jgi:hypothetical protein
MIQNAPLIPEKPSDFFTAFGAASFFVVAIILI